MGYNEDDGAERHLAGLNLVVVHSGWVPVNAGLTESRKLLVELLLLISREKYKKIGMHFAIIVINTIILITWTVSFR